MNTTNLISTPEITGNIGSCSTIKTQTVLKNGLLKETGIQVLTNSCTGEVTTLDYQSVHGSGIGVFLFLAVIIFALIVGGMASNY